MEECKIRKTNLIAILILATVGLSAVSAKGFRFFGMTLDGYVTDAITGENLSGVKVSLIEGG